MPMADLTLIYDLIEITFVEKSMLFNSKTLATNVAKILLWHNK